MNEFKNNAQVDIIREEFDRNRVNYNHKVYKIYFPARNGSPIIMSGPAGYHQIIRMGVHYFNGKNNRFIVKEMGDGDVMSVMDMGRTVQTLNNESIIVNIDSKYGGMFYEEDGFVSNAADDGKFLIVIEAIPNINAQMTAYFVIYKNPEIAESSGDVKFMKIDQEEFEIFYSLLNALDTGVVV